MTSVLKFGFALGCLFSLTSVTFAAEPTNTCTPGAALYKGILLECRLTREGEILHEGVVCGSFSTFVPGTPRALRPMIDGVEWTIHVSKAYDNEMMRVTWEAVAYAGHDIRTARSEDESVPLVVSLFDEVTLECGAI